MSFLNKLLLLNTFIIKPTNKPATIATNIPPAPTLSDAIAKFPASSIPAWLIINKSATPINPACLLYLGNLNFSNKNVGIINATIILLSPIVNVLMYEKSGKLGIYSFKIDKIVINELISITGIVATIVSCTDAIHGFFAILLAFGPTVLVIQSINFFIIVFLLIYLKLLMPV